jgi:hypothetical protein
LNTKRFEEALGMLQASYEDLFLFRDRNAPGAPIIGHCYDFPVPNGVHPICAGPWLRPSLTFAGWNVTQGTAIVHEALVGFRAMLLRLASDPGNNFTLVETQGILSTDDWANELHPYPRGFKKMATAFLNTLKGKFPGRI